MSKCVWNEEFYASRTPSRKDGISSSVENRSRAKTVLFIEELGLELQCNRIVVATACVFTTPQGRAGERKRYRYTQCDCPTAYSIGLYMAPLSLLSKLWTVVHLHLARFDLWS